MICGLFCTAPTSLASETRAYMVADATTYGADRLWVLLEPIPVDVDSESSPPEDDSDEGLSQ